MSHRRKYKPLLRFYVILICALVLLTGTLVFVLVKAHSEKLPSDVDAAVFAQYLQAQDMDSAVKYWDNALEKYPSQGTAKKINEVLGEKLTKYISECVLYTQSADFDKAVFDSKYAAIEKFGARATTIFNEGISQLMNAYIAKQLSYDALKTALDNLNNFTSLQGTIASVRKTAETYYNSRVAYEAGVKNAQNEDYLAAIEQLEKVDKIDTESYASAQSLINDYKQKCYTATLEKAKDQADKAKYTSAVALLVSLQKYFPNDQTIAAKINEYQTKASASLVSYTGPVEHLFTHCLVAFPELGFKGAATYDLDCVDVYEFKKIIQSLYDKNYIMIDMKLLYEEVNQNGKLVEVKKNALMLPEGKKPFVFTIDDVVYDSRKMGQGMVDKLILDENGKVATYTKMADGSEVISYDNEVFPIVDAFVEAHPDFSFNGAKGMFALTGFQGILGYRTQKGSPNRESEITACKKVIAALKATGWTFGSHSYSHDHMKSISDSYFIEQIQQWKDEVEPLVGPVFAYIYPYGEWEIGTDSKSVTGFTKACVKHKALQDAGFRIFCGVGGKQYYFVEMGDEKGLFMDRRNLDGTALRNRREAYSIFFDTYEVYDHANRTVPFSS